MDTSGRMHRRGARPSFTPALPGRCRKGALKACLAATLILAWIFFPGLSGAQPENQEYQVKAAMLYRFLSFIELPDTAFDHPSDPITLCVFGENPFGISFAAVGEQMVQGRLFTVTYPDSDIPGQCLEEAQVVFIPSGTPPDTMRRVLRELERRPILTVGESRGFLEMGGMINFVMSEGRVRFEINRFSTSKSGLGISSKLLRIADRVVDE